MAAKKFCCGLKFCNCVRVGCAVTHRAPQAEIEFLRAELAKRDRKIAQLEAALADRDAKIERLTRDVATLQALVNQLLSRRRGSLRVPEGQGLLFAESAPTSSQTEAPTDDTASADGEADDEDDSPAKSQRPQGKKRTPGKIDTTGLLRERNVIDVPEKQRIDAATGKRLVQVGERVTEELDYQRGRLRVIEHVQVMYGLPPEEAAHREVAPRMAPLPPKPFENCIASALLLAWILVQKFCNHLPLYRQQRIFERDGMRLSRKTTCDWALASAELLAPIVECLLKKIRAGPVLQIDDTPVKCQGGRGQPNFQAYLWTFANPEVRGIVYAFTPGRDSASLAKLLGAFAGWLVGDGYSGNRAAAAKVVAADVLSTGIRLAGCWAHVHRKFRDASKEAAKTSRLFLDLIKKLYAIEREADEAGLSPEARAELRQRRSKPILIEIFTHAWQLRGRHSDAGPMAKAIGYLRNQHRELRRFLEDGRIPLDNNACERAIRPVAIGRRNWLFAGSMRGGRAAAVVFSLAECCRLAGVDPIDYFADVLVRVGTHPASKVDELLPENWARLFAKKPAPEAAHT